MTWAPAAPPPGQVPRPEQPGKRRFSLLQKVGIGVAVLVVLSSLRNGGDDGTTSSPRPSSTTTQTSTPPRASATPAPRVSTAETTAAPEPAGLTYSVVNSSTSMRSDGGNTVWVLMEPASLANDDFKADVKLQQLTIGAGGVGLVATEPVRGRPWPAPPDPGHRQGAQQDGQHRRGPGLPG